jgi:probable rRNA maturation factor
MRGGGQNDIEIRFQKRYLGVDARWVRRILLKTLAYEKKRNSALSVFLTDDKEIRKINKRYLNHDYATDVISFWLKKEHLAGSESKYLGDLVVSVETAKNTAKEMRIFFKEELARYLVHGTLHLLGYDDKKPVDKKRMCARQENILRA